MRKKWNQNLRDFLLFFAAVGGAKMIINEFQNKALIGITLLTILFVVFVSMVLTND